MALIVFFPFLLGFSVIYAVVVGYLYRWLNRRFPQWCLNVSSPFFTSSFIAFCYLVILSLAFGLPNDTGIDFRLVLSFMILLPAFTFFIVSNEKGKLTKPKKWLAPIGISLLLPLLLLMRAGIYL